MIGKTLAHYEITGLLGAGGMGDVYRARDQKLGRDVALKVLPEHMASDPARLSRFAREARVVAGLSHPNIVTLHSVDEADGVHFLTMELVEGEPLDRKLSAEGLPVPQILDLALPIADALAEAHAKGIIHRDLKPGNVMVSTDSGRVKVLDFGLAKLGDDFQATSATLDTVAATRAGAILGTPQYMSPEQARGEVVDHRSDIFSLGAMLYEMATGQQPFKGPSTIDVLSSVVRDKPTAVSDIRPDLPEPLARVIEKCLSKSPADRYQTARALYDELKALKADSDSGVLYDAPRISREPVSQSAPRGRRRTPLVAGVLAVAVIAILAVAWLSRRGEAPAGVEAGSRIVAVLPFENLGHEDDEYFAAGITDEITSRLALIDGLDVISRTSARLYAGTRKSLREIGEELGTDYILEGTIRWARSGDAGRVRISPRLIRVANDTQVWTDSYDREVTEIFAVQADIASRIAEALDVTLVARARNALNRRPTESMEAYEAYLLGEREFHSPGFSAESFNLSVQMFERAIELDPNFALAHARLSSINSRVYHYGYDRTPQRLQQAKAAAGRALQLQSDLAEAHLALGHYYYWGTRDYSAALEALDEAQRYAPGLTEVLLTSAYVKRRQGDFDAAIAALEKYRNLSPRDPNGFVALGETYGTMRHYAAAEQAFEHAIALAPDVPYPYTELGLLYLRWRGDAAAARTILEKAPTTGNSEVCRVGYLVELFERNYAAARQRLDTCPGPVLEAGGFYTPVALADAMLYRLENQPEPARGAFDDARVTLEDKLAATPDDHRIEAALGMAYAGLGRVDDATRHGRRAVELYPLSRDALSAPIQTINLALIYTMTGQIDAALSELDAALSIPSILSVAWLRADPRWDALRENPGFEAMLKKHSAATD